MEGLKWFALVLFGFGLGNIFAGAMLYRWGRSSNRKTVKAEEAEHAQGT